MLKDENEKAMANEEKVNEKVEETTQSEIDVLKAEVENLRKEVEEYKDKLLRKVAEFENYKKRLEADFSNAVKYANEKLFLEILPIVDDLERSLASGKEKPDFDSFYQGVKMIYSKLMKVLESHGVKPFESVGKPFDFYYHEALLRIPRDDVPPDTVIDEVERGYMYYDKVLRHAKVIVSSPVEKQVTEDKKDDLKTNFSDDHRGKA
jgi:molecular chaperone GrpE